MRRSPGGDWKRKKPNFGGAGPAVIIVPQRRSYHALLSSAWKALLPAPADGVSLRLSAEIRRALPVIRKRDPMDALSAAGCHAYPQGAPSRRPRQNGAPSRRKG